MTAEKVTKYKTDLIEATFPHSHISNVMHVVSKLGVRIVDTVYTENVQAKLEVRLSKTEELKSALVNQTSGNVSLRLIRVE